MAGGTAMMTAVLRLFLRLRYAHGEPTSSSTRGGIPSRLGLLAPLSLVSSLKSLQTFRWNLLHIQILSDWVDVSIHHTMKESLACNHLDFSLSQPDHKISSSFRLTFLWEFKLWKAPFILQHICLPVLSNFRSTYVGSSTGKFQFWITLHKHNGNQLQGSSKTTYKCQEKDRSLCPNYSYLLKCYCQFILVQLTVRQSPLFWRVQSCFLYASLVCPKGLCRSW